MCNGETANNTINTCNGNDCTDFILSHGQNGRVLIDQPAVWTENEEGYIAWGDDTVVTPDQDTFFHRSAADQAYVVSRWFARGGCVMNYYMYHGGHHYGRWAGGGISNNYVNWANLMSDGLPNEPKYSHLTRLHNVVRDIAQYVITMPAQYNSSIPLYYFDTNKNQWIIGTQQVAFVYGPIMFMESSAVIPLFVRDLQNNSFYVMANSILIFNRGQVIFNTSDVRPPTQKRVYQSVDSLPTNTSSSFTFKETAFNWTVYHEPIFCPINDCPQTSFVSRVFGGQHLPSLSSSSISSSGPPVYRSPSPYEQYNVTFDLTDNLWYEIKFELQSAVTGKLYITGASANAYVVFLDGQYVGDCYDTTHRGVSAMVGLSVTVGNVAAGAHILSLLSVSLGMENNMFTDGVPYASHFKGIMGNVGVGDGNTTLITGEWTMRPYVVGEYLGIYTTDGAANVQWSTDVVSNTPLTWYRSAFTPIYSRNTSELMLSAVGIGRGHIWINGRDIGRYWTILAVIVVSPLSNGI